MASNLPNDRLRHPGESELGFAALSGRLLVQFVPVALLVVMLEAGLALSLYPALGDSLQESWLSLGLEAVDRWRRVRAAVGGGHCRRGFRPAALHRMDGDVRGRSRCHDFAGGGCDTLCTPRHFSHQDSVGPFLARGRHRVRGRDASGKYALRLLGAVCGCSQSAYGYGVGRGAVCSARDTGLYIRNRDSAADRRGT